MTSAPRVFCCLLLLTVATALRSVAQTQTNQPKTSGQTPAAQAGQKVPVMDGGAGPCSLELTVITADGKPVSAADVKVHITYGFAGFRRLDLEAGTNADGKVNFIGLPSRVHLRPLEFRGAKDQLAGTVTYDPAVECQAKKEITLEKPKPTEGK